MRHKGFFSQDRELHKFGGREATAVKLAHFESQGGFLSRGSATVPRSLVYLLFGLAALSTLGGLLGGPALGDHEALVAECARQMRLSGDWIVPQFLDVPFIRKPPLAYWLVAATSFLFPGDAATGLPVTPFVARLPSALAGFGTIFLLWRLGTSMFGRRAGVLAVLVASSSVYTLLYSPNATVEMPLTFCCTWAFAHFWFALTTPSAPRRFAHLMLFYVALGISMLAKAPIPLALVAVPLAFWWYTEAPQRVLARGGPLRFRRTASLMLRELKRQTLRVPGHLWVFPGVFLFFAIFVPWVIAVAERYPFAWDMWNWQYLQRSVGDFEDTRVRGVLYYLPIIGGLIAPWTLSLFEGLLAPWLSRYRRQRRALYFVTCWAGIGTVIMCLMGFKRPYYILPVLPGIVLLIAPVLDGLVAHVSYRPGKVSAGLVAAIIPILLLAVVAAFFLERAHMLTLAVWPLGVLAVALLWSALEYTRGRAMRSLATIALGFSGMFITGWYVLGPSLDNIERTAALDRELDEALVPENAAVYFADQRPDARLGFYFRRHPQFMVDPAELVTRSVVRDPGAVWLRELAVSRAATLLAAAEPVYIVLDNENVPLLEYLPSGVRDRVRVLATIRMDGKLDGDDWVVLTNAPRRRADASCSSPVKRLRPIPSSVSHLMVRR